MARGAGGPQEGLADRFERFAAVQCDGSSPLYAAVCRRIAADPEILTLAAAAPPGQPVPNLLLAAAHYLMLGEGADPASIFGSYLEFAGFCRKRRDRMSAVIAARRVQTNEPGRCAYLLPALIEVRKICAARPFAVVEIGASAGLNLFWDRYAYDYGDGAIRGEHRSPVRLSCALRGSRKPSLPPPLPEVTRRLGIDLSPVDLRDADAVRWLRALVWADDQERAERLYQALEIARRHPPEMIAGDALRLLPGILAGLPEAEPACVVHTHMLNQLTPEGRARLDEILRDAARSRDIFVVSAERIDIPRPRLDLAHHARTGSTRSVLAYCHDHGKWLAWEAD